MRFERFMECMSTPTHLPISRPCAAPAIAHRVSRALRASPGSEQGPALAHLTPICPCATAPRNQCSTYYRTGSYESCPTHWVQWRLCLQGKIGALQGAAEAEGDAIARERGLAGKHVWDFKPKYEAEAFVRYRIKPRTRTDADVEEVR